MTPWHSSATSSLELDLFVDPDPMIVLSEAFMFHPPDELPMMQEKHDVFGFAGKRRLEILISPSVIISDESLKSLQASDRSCYFKGERKLRFFKVYTRHNCEIECFSNYSLDLCKCVSFDIIRDKTTKVCGITEKDIDCGGNFLLTKYRIFYSRKGFASCSCLPTCKSVTYNFEVRETKLRGDE